MKFTSIGKLVAEPYKVKEKWTLIFDLDFSEFIAACMVVGAHISFHPDKQIFVGNLTPIGFLLDLEYVKNIDIFFQIFIVEFSLHSFRLVLGSHVF